jgi:hypothetical protein
LHSIRTFAAVVAAAMSVAAPALAETILSGTDAHQRLAGQTFDFNCVDGTRGQATYGKSGVATASYRLPTAGEDAAIQKDHGRVRSEGNNVCIRWNNLNGGNEGCYRMTERRPGVYRIAEGQLRWCELSVRSLERASN